MIEPRPPFDTLPPAARRRAAEASVLEDVPRGRVLFDEGEPSRYAWVVRQGRVHAEHRRPDGSTQMVCALGPGDSFCCLSILDGGPCPATAVAAVRSDVVRLPAGLFRELMDLHPAYAHAVLRTVCHGLRRMGCRDPGPDAGAHVAMSLLSLSEKFGRDLPFTRREIAELAGVVLETAIRELRRFESWGWVDLERGRLLVLDPAALRLRAVSRRRSGIPLGPQPA